jgi:hypothetical protein
MTSPWWLTSLGRRAWRKNGPIHASCQSIMLVMWPSSAKRLSGRMSQCQIVGRLEEEAFGGRFEQIASNLSSSDSFSCCKSLDSGFEASFAFVNLECSRCAMAER